jgi:hypothetical protein
MACSRAVINLPPFLTFSGPEASTEVVQTVSSAPPKVGPASHGEHGMTTAVEARFQERAEVRAANNMSLRRLLTSAIAATDPEDLVRQNPDALIDALS